MDSLYHVIEAQQFSREILDEIFVVTREMENVVSRYGSSILNRRIMATLFYEPSTRTRLSFEAAMRCVQEQVSAQWCLCEHSL